jgi:diguanylate cyclase (GGDEF)-like protein/PAS domain S-box-containing protein
MRREASGVDAPLTDEQLLDAFLEHTPDAVYFKDRGGRFLKLSRASARRLGLGDAEEAVGRTEADLLPPDETAERRRDEHAVIESGRAALEIERPDVRADGTPGWTVVSRVPIRDEAGDVVGTFAVSRDITERKRAELALGQQTDRLSRIVEIQRDIAAAGLDLSSVMHLICERTQELTGGDGAGIILLAGDAFVHEAGTGPMHDLVGACVPLDGTLTGWVCQNGATICRDSRTDPRIGPLAAERGLLSMVAVPLEHREGIVGVLHVAAGRPGAFDDEDLRTLELVSVVLSAATSHAAEFEAKRAQVEALSSFRTIFEGASIGIARVDSEGRNVEANPALEQMLGYSAAELAELKFDRYTHPEDLEHHRTLFEQLMAGEIRSYWLEKRAIRKDGAQIWLQVTAALEGDATAEPRYAIAMIEDITKRKLAEAELVRQAELNQHLALHDALTGLANRKLFRDRIQQAILAAERAGEGVAVLMMDLDRFKEINDSLGHFTGDALLQELAQRIRGVLRASDTVARLGGDEFGVLLPRQSDPALVQEVIAKIRDAVEQPIVLQELPLAMEASIGVAFYPEHGPDADTLIQRADVAMYAAKESDRAYAFYDGEKDTYDPLRLTLVAELRRAIEARELVLHYQPKAVFATGEVGSVEALIRWQHPERGLVPPDAFIPLAQRTGLIKPLTLYVVDEALRQCRAWADGGIHLSVAVNLTMRNLLDLEFPELVAGLLEQHEVLPERLEFEITESTMLADPARAKLVLGKLSAMGIRLSIDDFGTGYSSLSYLTRLPIREIKIDRSFVMNMSADEDDATIVRSTIELGRNLGLEVVAEGVETADLWERLSDLGCTIAQGIFLSRPLPADELTAWLADRSGSAVGEPADADDRSPGHGDVERAPEAPGAPAAGADATRELGSRDGLAA